LYKKIIALILFGALLVAVGCTEPTSSKKDSNKTKVYATFYPMYDLAKSIGGDKIVVSTLVPPGIEPHEWEPSPKTLAKSADADLIVANGLGMEPWLAQINESIGKVQVVQLAEGITSLHDGSHIDPHVWLDPTKTKEMAKSLTEELVKVDGENQAYYEDNLKQVEEKLNKLDQEYVNVLSTAKNRNFVVSHQAFSYLAKKYNLNQIALRGLDAESEPTPAVMAEVINYCKSHHVKYVFYEELINPKLSNLLAQEVGAKLLKLNPLESLTEDEIKQGKDYFSVMQDNLANLKLATK
jgi:zinc transport system substrate-binding protein